MTKPIDQVRVKIERAKEHVRDLEARIQAFFKSNPYRVIREDDPETGDSVFRVQTSVDVPIEWAAMVGDVIQNLRSSLDHLVWQLVLANGGTPDRHTGFPIGEDANKYKAQLTGKVQGMSQTALDQIDALKPYAGGNDPLWRLHDLNNVDKHRLLLAVGSAHRNIVIDFGKAFPDMRISAPLALRPADRLFPLKDGAEVYRILAAARGSEIDEDPKFTFEIAFGESQIADGEPLIPTLHQLVNLVDAILRQFEPLL